MIPSELHAHVFMDGIDYKKSVSRFKNGVDKAAVKAVLSEYKKRGITLVRDGGDHFDACLYAREIAPQYGITYLIPIHALYKEGNYGRVAGVPYRNLFEYREMVQKAKKMRADFIKIMVSGILDFNHFGIVSETSYNQKEVNELVHIAHEEGFAVMAHASGTEAVRRAAEAGADSIEHGYYIDEETMDILSEKGIVWVPTAVTSANLKGTGRFDEKEVTKITDTHKSAIRKAAEKNVWIGCGSDAGAYAVLHGSGCLQEYALLNEILGAETDRIISEAEQIIRQKFRYPARDEKR